MALTLANVRQFRNYLKDLEVITDELLKARERQRIFANNDELQDALVACKHNILFYLCKVQYKN